MLVIKEKTPNCICSGCGGDFYRIPSEIARQLKKGPDTELFCCKKCERSFRGMIVKLKCAVCTKEFTRKINRIGGTKHHFCGRLCTIKASTAEVALSGSAAHKKMREGVVGDKMRECLGWCGKLIKSDAKTRFCPACRSQLSDNSMMPYTDPVAMPVFARYGE